MGWRDRKRTRERHKSLCVCVCEMNLKELWKIACFDHILFIDWKKTGGGDDDHDGGRAHTHFFSRFVNKKYFLQRIFVCVIYLFVLHIFNSISLPHVVHYNLNHFSLRYSTRFVNAQNERKQQTNKAII